MSKRKFVLNESTVPVSTKRYAPSSHAKKHTLDSDEEDDHDETSEVMDSEEIEGEEDGVSGQHNGVRMTAFNMKEELEEGHFDKQGHFIWRNEKDIRDNWLDNIDWHNVKNEPGQATTTADSSDDDEISGGGNNTFNEIAVYGQMLALMKPRETVNRTIRRLGGAATRLSSVERLRRKKAGLLDNNQDVIIMTEFANNILTNMGNMDVYQETYEEIAGKIEAAAARKAEPVLDMYADDFDSKEKEQQLKTTDNFISTSVVEQRQAPKWEFKWDQTSDKIEGPYDNKQMIKWAREGYFKTGVWARKLNDEGNFYSTNRIDFELYE